MIWDLSAWPTWLVRLFWTGITLGIAYGVGLLIDAIVVSRLARIARRSERDLDDIVIAELKRRIPFWAVLIGAWISLGHGPLGPNALDVWTKALFAVGVASVTLAASAIAVKFVAVYGPRQTPTMPVAGLTRNVTKMLVLALGVLVILNGLGVSITPMLTALGVGGLAVALALQEPLSNLFAGIFISLAGQIRIGDYVKLDSGEEGFVADLNWRCTGIRMLANNLILVPNAKLAQSIVINYSLPETDQAVLVQVGVDYASDLPTVERVTIEVAREVMQEVQGGVPAFEPFIRYHTFADSSINFTVILRGQTYVDQYLVKHEFVKRLQARYEREGIVIPWPIRTLVAREPGLQLADAGGGLKPSARP
jgi:small-conductance mechanosensitive channel